MQLVADLEKWNFRSRVENKGRFISSGIWRYSRHPNYFGEIMLWTGLAVMACNGLKSEGSGRLLAFASLPTNTQG